MPVDANLLRSLITSGDTKGAFHLLTAFFQAEPQHPLRNDALLLQARWATYQRDFTAGLPTDATIPSQTLKGLLDLVDQLEKQPKDKPEINSAPKFVLVYDKADNAHSEALNRNLTLLKRLNKIRVYNVYEGFAGDVVAAAEKEIQDANYVLALVTANLFYSEDDWIGVLEKANSAGRRIIPVRFEEVPEYPLTFFARLASLPRSRATVKDFPGLDAAYTEIVTEIRKLLPA